MKNFFVFITFAITFASRMNDSKGNTWFYFSYYFFRKKPGILC